MFGVVEKWLWTISRRGAATRSTANTNSYTPTFWNTQTFVDPEFGGYTFFFVSIADAIGHHSVFLHLSNDFSSVTRSTTFQSRFGRFFKGKHSHCGVQQRAVCSEANLARLPSVSIHSNEKTNRKHDSNRETARFARIRGDSMACEPRVSCGDSEIALLWEDDNVFVLEDYAICCERRVDSYHAASFHSVDSIVFWVAVDCLFNIFYDHCSVFNYNKK